MLNWILNMFSHYTGHGLDTGHLNIQNTHSVFMSWSVSTQMVSLLLPVKFGVEMVWTYIRHYRYLKWCYFRYLGHQLFEYQTKNCPVFKWLGLFWSLSCIYLSNTWSIGVNITFHHLKSGLVWYSFLHCNTLFYQLTYLFSFL